MTFYFGYGSNLNFRDWSDWCSKRDALPNGLVEYERAFLPGYSVNYSHYSVSREGGAANLYDNIHGLCGTYGVLFTVDENCLNLLDEKEGHPRHYLRTNVVVITESGKHIEAITYISSKYDEGSYFLPTNDYHRLIQTGLLDRNMPTTEIDLAREDIDNTNMGFIIAYGTLKKGQLRESLMPGDFVSNGYIKGDLYDLGPYPGLIGGYGRVLCEIYSTTNLVDDVRLLDRIEGTDLNPPLYQRKLIPVECDDGKLRYGICYFYNGDFDEAAKIADGVWN
jgi:gamma-glutamylcyclotransferase (GGCT)/AIG2-like uncharacterized protein YtfP